MIRTIRSERNNNHLAMGSTCNTARTLNGLAGSAEHAQRREVVLGYKLVAEALECADGRGGGVERVDRVLLANIPVASGVRVIGHSLVKKIGAQ